MYSYVVCFSLDDHGRLFDCVSLDELVSAMSAGLTVGHSRGPILRKLGVPKRPGMQDPLAFRAALQIVEVLPICLSTVLLPSLLSGRSVTGLVTHAL